MQSAKQIIRDRLLDTGVYAQQILTIEQDHPWPHYMQTEGAIFVTFKGRTFAAGLTSCPGIEHWFDNYGTAEILPS